MNWKYIFIISLAVTASFIVVGFFFGSVNLPFVGVGFVSSFVAASFVAFIHTLGSKKLDE